MALFIFNKKINLNFSTAVSCNLTSKTELSRWHFDCYVSPISFSCCTCLEPDFSFIILKQGDSGIGIAVFPSYMLYFLSSLPQRRFQSKHNFQCRWNIWKEIGGYSWNEVTLFIFQTGQFINGHTHTHFFALSTKSLLQKGEIGQKTRSLITLSSNIILIFSCHKDPERGKRTEAKRDGMSGKCEIR